LLDPEDARIMRELKDKIQERRRKKSIKLEPLEVPPGTFKPGEVIDLTADDD